ncbi:MAG: hypothetical protein ACREFG_09695 [Chthoniobacterales bacterium]
MNLHSTHLVVTTCGINDLYLQAAMGTSTLLICNFLRLLIVLMLLLVIDSVRERGYDGHQFMT